LKKGSLVSIEGRISRRSYVSKQTNQTVYVMEVVVENINSLSSNRSADEAIATNNAQTPSVSDIFPESSINNLEPSEQKVEQPKYDENDDLE
jgi:single-stranded DNA-binding protein